MNSRKPRRRDDFEAIDRTPEQQTLLDDDGKEILTGRDERLSGPSDSSDAGADVIGVGRSDDTSDRSGTGERMSADDDHELVDSADISADRIIEARQAGLGSGLDQAEEAQLGITDEEIEELEDDEQ
jgi:hypothetical protein